MSPGRLLCLGLAALGLLAPAREALAYCRTSGCDGFVGAVCEPAQTKDCGTPIFWESSCLGYSVQRDASSQVDLETTEALVAQAFEVWQSAACGGGTPSFSAENLGPVSCHEVAYDAEEKNANVIMFRDDAWPYGAGAALALTTVTYVLETGAIRDADMEINSANATLTLDDTAVVVDLASILTHEVGHFLGLSHSPVADATMFPDYPPQSISLRTLDPDDVAGICAVFPPGTSKPCDPEPVNGLGDECGEPAPAEDDGCSVGSAAPRVGAIWLALLSAGAWRARQRRRASHRRNPGPGWAS